MPASTPVHVQLPLAASGLTAYTFVRAHLGSNQHVEPANSPLHAAVGVVQAGTGSARNATVIVHGDTQILYGATVAAGDPLTTNSLGRAVPAAPGQVVHGYALEAGTNGSQHLMTLLRQTAPAELRWTTPLAALVAGANWGQVAGAYGHLLALFAHIGIGATGSGRTATLQPTVNGVAVTGGVLNLTTANCSTGATVAASAISGANAFGPRDTIGFNGSGLAAFADGYASFVLVLGG